MTQKKLILFNGPPRCGKDTAANYVWTHVNNSRLFKISQPIKSAVQAAFGLTDAQVKQLEATKDEPNALLFNSSYRDVQISFSEDWAKEKFGINVFGRLAMRHVQASFSSVFICSDSGFAYETVPLIKLVGPSNVLLFRIHRDGCTFDNDSRSYIKLKCISPDIVELDVYNNASKQEYKDNIFALVQAWLNPSES